MDRRKVPHLGGLRREHRDSGEPRRDADQYHALLGDGRDRLVVLALLRPDAFILADPGGRTDRGADRLCRVSQRDPEAAALGSGAVVREYPTLDRDGERRPLRRPRAARGPGAGDTSVLQAVAVERGGLDEADTVPAAVARLAMIEPKPTS